MKKDLATFVIGASLALTLMYGGVVGYLWQQGLFDIPETESGARVLAAVLALLGGLFAALLTFAGVLLKHSVDERNLALGQEVERRLELEGKRNLELKKEAEDRLKLDTFIRAAGLLATATGQPAPKTQQAAALFALADLKHLRFALALLGEIWPKGGISPSAACWLIDQCLQSDDEYLQIEAAGTLKLGAKSLPEVGCFAWPELLERTWPKGLPFQARGYFLEALLACLVSRRPNEWTVGCLIPFVIYLARVKNNEEEEALRNGAILCLDALLSHVRLVELPDPIRLGEDVVVLEVLRPEVRELAHDPSFRTYSTFVETATKLKTWG